MGRARKKTIEEAMCCVPRREASVCARTRVVCESVYVYVCVVCACFARGCVCDFLISSPA